jgi:hypothetical protein
MKFIYTAHITVDGTQKTEGVLADTLEEAIRKIRENYNADAKLDISAIAKGQAVTID